MKVTHNWLKDFVAIKISPPALAQKLTMAGLEVTSLEEKEGDFVFELEVTSNRPDCLSVIGIAREVAAITNSKLKLPQATGHKPKAKSLQRAACSVQPISIKIENRKDCPLYTAKIIKGVKVGPSPDWLRSRLELIGCRSVNNIVDITNYLLFEWGQPLHAFDLDKLSGGTIIVRRGRDNEKIVTIDGTERLLDHDVLVIADKLRPIAIAGIVGGRDSEVGPNTQNILLEAAVFNPILIRRARRKLGPQTDSAYRFERGVDLARVGDISLRAQEMILKNSGGECIKALDSKAPALKKKRINLDIPTVSKILGATINTPKIKEILNNLGFKVNPVRNIKSLKKKDKISNGVNPKSKDKFSVEVPSHRQDINLEIDLIEELARIFGYERIRPTVPAVAPQITAYDTKDLISLIKNILVGLGINEVITYSLIDKDLLQAFGAIKSGLAIEILNPLSKEQELLRPTLIASLGRCVALNLNQKQEYINIFEIAKGFSKDNGSPKEELLLGIALSGVKSLFLEENAVKDKMGLLHLKGILEALFERLGIKDYNFARDNPYTVSVCAGGERVGLTASLPEDVLDKLDIKNKAVIVAEISLEKILPYVRREKRFSGLAAYPGILRDISFVLKEEIPVKDVLEAARERAAALLKEIKIVDYYKGKQIPAGFRGLTVSCLYRSDERTLTEAEVNPVHSSVLRLLTEKFGAKIR